MQATNWGEMMPFYTFENMLSHGVNKKIEEFTFSACGG
jgi:hypothetical protein